MWKTLAFLFATACGAWGAEPAPWIVESEWGPLASWMEDADGSARFRAAGPFWEEAEGTNGMSMRAYPRPLWARVADPVADRTAWDFAWPVASGKTFGKQKSWRVLISWFLDQDRFDARSQYRFWLMPIWFQGRDEQGGRYAGLFPLGGEIRNFLGRDRIRFALWPFWTRSQIHDVKTTDVLWPIYSRTTTPDHRREQFRVFPFYVWSKNARQFEKYAVLWPIWTHARYVHPKAQGTAWVLFPLCGRVNLNSQQGWMFLPPFFQHVRGEKLTRTYCPWPFFQRETGLREKFYLWPLFGWRKAGAQEQRFWAWPLVRRDQNERGKLTLTRWMVAPVYVNASQAQGAPNELRVTANRTKLWPLYSRIYDLDAESYRLRLLDLWPTGHPPPVERSWAPLWTLLDYRVNGKASDLDVLWGLYRDTRREGGARAFSLFPLWRHERAAADEARRWSVLKGLLAYDRTATNRQMRFLWLGRVRLASPDGKGAEPK
ncbi:MAG TPA: hypothetical protein DCM68_05365 [Verrucomicrobia bacterium]|nr:hypothetical protein [Verrucomicrobiota bacterium]